MSEQMLIAILLVCFGGLGLLCSWGYLWCGLVRRDHKFSKWYRYDLRSDYRHCRTCGIKQYKENDWWADLQRHAFSPYVEPVTSPLESCGTGTKEIPRLPSGALSSMPMPPRAEGPGHAVLSHGPLSLPS